MKKLVVISALAWLLVACAQPTPTPVPPTATPVPVLATRAEQIVGTWHGQWRDGMYHQINEDGTWIVAWELEDLESSPGALISYRFEGADLLLTVLEEPGLPSCPTKTATYQVELMADERIRFLAKQDDCKPRRTTNAQVHERVK
jgi:hypothetical protein